MFSIEVSFTHQGCIYLMKKTLDPSKNLSKMRILCSKSIQYYYHG